MLKMIATSLALSVFFFQSGQAAIYQGRLAKKGICGQHVIELLSSNAPLAVDAIWISPYHQTYYNAFTLSEASICTFPEHIKQGDVFLFTLSSDSNVITTCIRCKAFEAAPLHSHNITTLEANDIDTNV